MEPRRQSFTRSAFSREALHRLVQRRAIRTPEIKKPPLTAQHSSSRCTAMDVTVLRQPVGLDRASPHGAGDSADPMGTSSSRSFMGGRTACPRLEVYWERTVFGRSKRTFARCRFLTMFRRNRGNSILRICCFYRPCANLSITLTLTRAVARTHAPERTDLGRVCGHRVHAHLQHQLCAFQERKSEHYI